MTTFETGKLARKAAAYLGGPGDLARHLQVSRACVMRFISGRTSPNAIVITELQAIIANHEIRANAREKGYTDEYCTN